MKIIIIAMALFLAVFSGCFYEDTGDAAMKEAAIETEEKSEENLGDDLQEQEEEASLEDPPPVQDILDEFEKRLIQETDEDYRVIDFTTRQQLIDHISQVAVTSLAEEYVDSLYETKDGELYIIPRDGPMLIDTGESYQVEKINPSKYRLVQSGENELWGKYTVETIMEKIDGKWLISEINTEAN